MEQKGNGPSADSGEKLREGGEVKGEVQVQNGEVQEVQNGEAQEVQNGEVQEVQNGEVQEVQNGEVQEVQNGESRKGAQKKEVNHEANSKQNSPKPRGKSPRKSKKSKAPPGDTEPTSAHGITTPQASPQKGSENKGPGGAQSSGNDAPARDDATKEEAHSPSGETPTSNGPKAAGEPSGPNSPVATPTKSARSQGPSAGSAKEEDNKEGPAGGQDNTVPSPKDKDPGGLKAKNDAKISGSSSRATKVTQLPAIPPVSTIFGLTHHQIFTSKSTDVKVKLLMNSKTSAMCKNALDFVHTANQAAQPLFHDSHRMTQFITVCVNVALYEANGFNAVSKAHPELLAWLPEYDHLTLSHTKTNLTVSTKTAHKNPVDYTVLSFFGHILVWAFHLQNEARVSPNLSDRYGLNMSTAAVLRSLGGYHLWDRLRKEKTMNLKRWKHIQKFRQIFAFEENQFVLILRFMNLDTEIP